VTLDHATVDHTSTLACERREGRVAPPKRSLQTIGTPAYRMPPKRSLQTIGTPAYRMMSRATRPPTNSAKVTCVSLFHQRSTHLLHCLERIAGLTKNVAPTKCRPSPERRHTAGPATLLMQLNRNRLSAPLSGHVPASISGVASQSVARKATRRNSWRATLAATVSAHQLG
jgi:hypothetical protein